VHGTPPKVGNNRPRSCTRVPVNSWWNTPGRSRWWLLKS